jgi:hypothetical protein
MNKFIWYVTLSNSSKVCCMVESAKKFTTMDSHFVWPHKNFSSCNLLTTEDVQSMDRKEWLCFIVWNANSPSSAAICLHSSVVVSLVKCYFFTPTFSFCSNCMFSFLDMLQYIRMTSMLYWKLDLQVEHSTLPTCWSSFKNGYSASKLSVKTHLLFAILMIFYP